MKRRTRFLTWLAMLAAGGALFQGVGFTRTGLGGVGGMGGACQSQNFATNGILGSVDFCYLLDCENGFFGGVIQPCGDPNSTLDDYLVDCSPAPTTDTTDLTGNP